MKAPACNILRGLFFAAALGAGSCRTVERSSQAVDVDPRRWTAPATIALLNADTLTQRDMTLFLQCNEHFADDTLTLLIAVHTPDSLRLEEPFLFAAERGESPTAVMRELTAPYRRRSVLGRPGEYRLTITPCRPVDGVEAAGIRIVKSN